MKNKLLVAVPVLLIVLTFVQCGKNCKGVDCPVENYPIFLFRVLNNSGKDLLIGSYKQYDTAQLKIVGKNAKTGAMETVKPNFISSGDTAVVTSFIVSTAHSVYYLSLNNTVTDSLFFKYKNKVSECCDLSYFYLSTLNTEAVATAPSLPSAESFIIRK